MSPFLEHIPLFNNHVQSHNVTQSELQIIDPFSIENHYISFNAYATSDRHPISHITPVVAQEPPHATKNPIPFIAYDAPPSRPDCT